MDSDPFRIFGFRKGAANQPRLFVLAPILKCYLALGREGSQEFGRQAYYQLRPLAVRHMIGVREYLDPGWTAGKLPDHFWMACGSVLIVDAVNGEHGTGHMGQDAR